MRGQAVVIDGDTLEIQGKRVRLHGIDAPESDQIGKDKNEQNYRCGRAATQRLTELIGRRALTCEIRDRDRYGRWCAICSISEQDIILRMKRVDCHVSTHCHVCPPYFL